MSADRQDERGTRGRGVYPHAGVEGLSGLNDLHDFKVVDGEPDIRGWKVLGMDGRKAGKVHDLLVDTAAMQVRYLDVELDRSTTGGVKGRHVLVPIGVAQLDDDHDDVRLPQLSLMQLADMPAFEHRTITREEELQLLGRFGTVGSAATAGTLASPPAPNTDFYAQPHFDEAGLRRAGSNADAASGRGYITRSGAAPMADAAARKAGEVDVPRKVEVEGAGAGDSGRTTPATERRPGSGEELDRGTGQH